LLLNFALEFTTRNHEANQKDLKFICTHQLLGYAEDALALGESIRTKMKNTKTLLVACKEAGLEVTTEKPKFMFVSREQSAGYNYNKK
jgi:hypothetical protein